MAKKQKANKKPVAKNNLQELNCLKKRRLTSGNLY